MMQDNIELFRKLDTDVDNYDAMTANYVAEMK